MSQTIIVFLEDCILAATGKEGKYPNLSKVKKIGLQVQGDSYERWENALKELPNEWKAGQAHLVLPAGLCSARVLKLPYAKGKQLADMAAKEVADSFRNEVADYSIVSAGKKSGVDICVGGADAEQLESFRTICKEAGIEIGGMTVPMEGYLHILQQLDSFWNKTAIYLFFEEGSMTSVLCQEGEYLYSGRNRLFSEPGTLDFGTEIVRSISGILQFYTAEKRETPITDVYYVGCPAVDFEVSIEGLENLNLKAQPMPVDGRIFMPGGEQAADWIPCIGAMIKKGKGEKRIDLYRANKKFFEKGEKHQGIAKHLIVPIMVLIACLIPVGGASILNYRALREIEKKENWIASDSVREQYGKALALEEELADIEGAIGAVELTDQNLSVYPELSSDILRQIENAGGSGISCRITGYDASTGVLTFKANSQAVIDVPDYILKLQNSGLFHTVNYTGYDYDKEWYSLSLSCAMEGKISDRAKAEGITQEMGETQTQTDGQDTVDADLEEISELRRKTRGGSSDTETEADTEADSERNGESGAANASRGESGADGIEDEAGTENENGSDGAGDKAGVSEGDETGTREGDGQ